ncbi:MAG: carboxypeptidase regulatory-like domain-containing protein [Firmicutes bacterium]|nr:carboxypeptidase regulatory-like domain-containing protein [Bacillota bacterium]
MYDPGFWRSFRKLGLITVALCLGGCYLAITLYTIGPSLMRTESVSAVSGFLPPSDRGTIESVVCDVLGNPVPGASVKVLDAKVVTDGQGKFRIENVPLGLVDIHIVAAGFQAAIVSITVDPGMNYPHIKFDTGLYPAEFHVRFHAFTNSLEEADTRLLFGLVEVVNPSKEPVYISRLEVKDPAGRVVYDLVESMDILRLVSQTYELQLVMEPIPAYVIGPKSMVVFELDALPRPLRGDYHLWLTYASPENHARGRFLALHMADEMDYDPDLDPHSPR